MFKCEHCGGKFKHNADGSVTCSKCGCVFRLVLARYNSECYQRMFPDKGKITLREVRKKKTRRRKR